MIVEGRTITNVAEMLEFCRAAVGGPRRPLGHPAAYPVNMRVQEITLANGRKVYATMC